MDDNKYLYTSGEFAKLIGVNKRTLHYYNDIGLFTPEHIGVNGYHYYTINQFAEFELIHTLRQVGVPLNDIFNYSVSDTRDESFKHIMENQKSIIDSSIERLLNIRNFLQIKAKRLELGMKAEDKKIEIATLPERHVIYSQKIDGKLNEEDIGIAADFSMNLKKRFNLYDTFGSRIKVSNIIEGNYSNYESYYAYCPNDYEEYDEILPEGKYLMAYSGGHWNKLPELYKKINHYINENNIKLTGYSYEEGLNELTLKEIDDYITLITIKVDESSIK